MRGCARAVTNIFFIFVMCTCCNRKDLCFFGERVVWTLILALLLLNGRTPNSIIDSGNRWERAPLLGYGNWWGYNLWRCHRRIHEEVTCFRKACCLLFVDTQFSLVLDTQLSLVLDTQFSNLYTAVDSEKERNSWESLPWRSQEQLYRSPCRQW